MCTLYYMIVKDAMVVIHLAKMTLLEGSCDYFRKVIIPLKVYEEIIKGEGVYPDVVVVKDLITQKKINVKEVKRKELLNKANEFGIYGGEAEAIALYWQEKADYLATDDDNVRKKNRILDIKTIGTPAIVLKLYNEKMIKKEKLLDSLNELREIGWFSNAVIDRILMEVK